MYFYCYVLCIKICNYVKYLNSRGISRLQSGNFTASAGWLRRWLTRYGIRLTGVSDEACFVTFGSLGTPSIFQELNVRSRWQKLEENLAPRDVFLVVLSNMKQNFWPLRWGMLLQFFLVTMGWCDKLMFKLEPKCSPDQSPRSSDYQLRIP